MKDFGFEISTGIALVAEEPDVSAWFIWELPCAAKKKHSTASSLRVSFSLSAYRDILAAFFRNTPCPSSG
jgi:hypothetical protein